LSDLPDIFSAKIWSHRSRLENVPDARTLYRIGIGYIDFFCRSYDKPPTSIVLDIDDIDDLVHGGQQLALFNTHVGGHCFQPIHIFEGNSGKPILSLLRPGKRPSGEEIARVLRHVIRRIRRHWPSVRILVRADSHYCARKCSICCVVCAATTSLACRSM
jgi:Transposase DDE domain group 1